MDNLVLIYPIAVRPHQSVRVAKGFFYQPTEIKKFKNDIQIMTRAQLPKGFNCIDKNIPVIITCIYTWKWNGSKKTILPLPKITKPDITDNCNKALIDSLAGIVYNQDQQIYDFHPIKYWDKECSIKITVTY